MNFIDFLDFFLKHVVCSDIFYINVQSNF
jgi:hypothetical protein